MGNDFKNAAYVEVRDGGRAGRSSLLANGRSIVMAMGLALVIAVAAASATLTDAMTTSNAYSFGDVSIKLSDTSGAVAPIKPGASITRASAIENTGTVPAYVFLKVVMPTDSGTEVFSKPAAGSGWFDITSSTKFASTPGTYVFAYGSNGKLAELAAKRTVSQSSAVTYPSTASTHDNVQVDVTAYAIQTTDVKKAGSEKAATETADFWGLVEGLTARTAASK